MWLVGLLPVLIFGPIGSGSVAAAISDLYKGAAPITMNILITVAVIATYPLQFFPAIQVIEGLIWSEGTGAGAYSPVSNGDGPPRQQLPMRDRSLERESVGGDGTGMRGGSEKGGGRGGEEALDSLEIGAAHCGASGSSPTGSGWGGNDGGDGGGVDNDDGEEEKEGGGETEFTPPSSPATPALEGGGGGQVANHVGGGRGGGCKWKYKTFLQTLLRVGVVSGSHLVDCTEGRGQGGGKGGGKGGGSIFGVLV